jgi:hypothetical protein
MPTTRRQSRLSEQTKSRIAWVLFGLAVLFLVLLALFALWLYLGRD